MPQVSVDHELPVHARKRAGDAPRTKHQARFEQQDSTQPPRGRARQAQPRQRTAALIDARRERRREREHSGADEQGRDDPQLTEAFAGKSIDAGVASRGSSHFEAAVRPEGAHEPLTQRRDRCSLGGVHGKRAGGRAAPGSRVVGAAHEQHPGAPGEVGRERRHAIAVRSAWRRQRDRRADARVQFGGDLLRERDPARLREPPLSFTGYASATEPLPGEHMVSAAGWPCDHPDTSRPERHEAPLEAFHVPDARYTFNCRARVVREQPGRLVVVRF